MEYPLPPTSGILKSSFDASSPLQLPEAKTKWSAVYSEDLVFTPFNVLPSVIKLVTSSFVTKRTLFFLRNEIRQCINSCLLYTSPSPRDRQKSRMPSSA